MDSLILMGIDWGKIHYVLINEPVLAQRKLLHEIMNFPAKYETEHGKLKRWQQNASCTSAGEGERPFAAPDLHRPLQIPAQHEGSCSLLLPCLRQLGLARTKTSNLAKNLVACQWRKRSRVQPESCTCYTENRPYLSSVNICLSHVSAISQASQMVPFFFFASILRQKLRGSGNATVASHCPPCIHPRIFSIK